MQATYTLLASSIATTTSASHILQVMGDGTNYGRLHRLKVQQVTLAGAEALAQLQIVRLETAGTGGSAVSARPFDLADTDPYGGGGMTLPSSKGTEGDVLLQERMLLIDSAIDDVGGPYARWEWYANDFAKPIVFGNGTADGLALKIVTGIATSTVDVTLEFSVTATL